MQLRYIIIFFAAAIMAGWIAPDLLPQKTAQPADRMAQADITATSDDPAQEAEDALEDYYNEVQEIAIERSSDGHFYADVDVDGTPVGFLIDTGASSIALTGADAEAIGLYWDDDELQVVGRGASGDVFGKPVTLKEVTLGDFVVRNVPAAIVPNGLDKSLLGQSFLKEIENVNISGDLMVLR